MFVHRHWARKQISKCLYLIQLTQCIELKAVINLDQVYNPSTSRLQSPLQQAGYDHPVYIKQDYHHQANTWGSGVNRDASIKTTNITTQHLSFRSFQLLRIPESRNQRHLIEERSKNQKNQLSQHRLHLSIQQPPSKTAVDHYMATHKISTYFQRSVSWVSIVG